MTTFGLIGKKLQHSFSKKYFTEKFAKQNLHEFNYELFELESIEKVKALFQKKDLLGLNVTVPYKEAVIPFLDKLDQSASQVGAVNVIKIEEGIKTGYNSDYFGFRNSLLNCSDPLPESALVLGSGGASKAVTAALKSLDIAYKIISRSSFGDLTYSDLNKDHIQSHFLIINTTPLGMYPDIDSSPDVPYQYLTQHHFLYDLVYNPEITLFMQKGAQIGCKTKNGLEMLHLQAEKSWEIWNS